MIRYAKTLQIQIRYGNLEITSPTLKTKFIDNSFWVNKLVTINSDKYDYGMSPVDTFTIHNRHPNSFYTNNSVSGSGSENNSAGLFLGILAVLVAIGAVLVLTHK